MNEYKAMGSITLRLLEYINDAPKKDINYEIALTLLNNFDKVKKMNITEISELCYVSPATISRFCRMIGFSNFSEFKTVSNIKFSLENDYSRELLTTGREDIKAAFKNYTNSLMENMNYVLDNINYDDIDYIAKKIYETEKVAFFCKSVCI